MLQALWAYIINCKAYCTLWSEHSWTMGILMVEAGTMYVIAKDYPRLSKVVYNKTELF